jgi:hypothetical protein
VGKRWCLVPSLGGLALLLMAAAGAPDGVWRTVEHEGCRLAVRLPEGWAVHTVTWEFGSVADCAVGLRPPGWSERRARSDLEIPEEAVYIGVSSGTLENACEHGPVCRDADGWYFEGRAGARLPAREIRTPVGIGIRGDIETGAYLQQGGYAGAASAFIAVVSRRGRLATFIAAHAFRDEPVFDRIVREFAFR